MAKTKHSFEESVEDMIVLRNRNSLSGKIKSVYCKHFVTYEECTFQPTEYLNVIIGPNGTGKSTLVAAIVLALGGDPKLLSRSSSIQDYIKNGRSLATVNVELYTNNHGKTVVFQRTFNEDGKSEYSVNAEKISKSNFLNSVSAYKIQINNLCQFLPQDRVQDFAKMNPQEILQNTISSVCSQSIIDNFTKLKDLRKMQLNEKELLSQNIQKLKESMNRVEELKQILHRYRTRNECEEMLKVCNAKKLWLHVNELKVKLTEQSKDYDTATKTLKERQKAYEELARRQSSIATTTANLLEDASKKERKSSSFLENQGIISKKVEELNAKIRMAKTDFEKKKREWTDRQGDLHNETKVLELMAQDLRNAKTTISSDSEQSLVNGKQLQDLKQEISIQIKKRSDINKQLDEEHLAEIQMLKKRIERSKNVAEQKLQLLRNNFPELYTAVEWLRQNENMFRGKVYNPTILELNVRDPIYAKYFENTISLRDLLAFTCEEKSDVSILVDELCIKQKLSVNVGHSPAASECCYMPNQPIESLKKYGFTSYLIDLIEGPPAILNKLCSLYNIHTIPIGTETVAKWTDSIPKTVRQYFGGDQRYMVAISKYSKEPSIMQSHITSKQLLSSVDANEIQKLTQRLSILLKKTDALRNERASIEVKINEIEHRRTEVITMKRAVDTKVARLEQLKEHYKRQEQKVFKLKNNIISVPDLEKELTSLAQQCLQNIIELQVKKVNALKSYQKAMAEKMVAQTRVNIYKQQNEELFNAVNEANEKKMQVQKLADDIARYMDNAKQKYKTKLVEAQSQTNNLKPTDTDFPYREQFITLPNNLNELKDSMNDYSARLACMDDIDQTVVSEYNKRCEDIESLKRSIEHFKNGDQNIEKQIYAIYKNWFPEITGIVDTINKHFSDFMASMSYVGEVLLAKQNNFDFDSYGIQIMVQYRKNVPLQALDRHVQSGGERAVAIAVYTLSMQHITHVPFRCVDEINQGMDARNERKIFEMLVEETTQVGRAQYFFVTPKLLPNLTYNERMSVHVVFNGKMIQPRDAFSFAL